MFCLRDYGRVCQVRAPSQLERIVLFELIGRLSQVELRSDFNAPKPDWNRFWWHLLQSKTCIATKLWTNVDIYRAGSSTSRAYALYRVFLVVIYTELLGVVLDFCAVARCD